MRALAVSSICLAVLLAGWGVFHYISAEKTDEYITEIKEVIIPAVRAGTGTATKRPPHIFLIRRH